MVFQAKYNRIVNFRLKDPSKHLHVDGTLNLTLTEFLISGDNNNRRAIRTWKKGGQIRNKFIISLGYRHLKHIRHNFLLHNLPGGPSPLHNPH